MCLEQGLPFWEDLAERQREELRQAAGRRSVARGTQVCRGDGDCVGSPPGARRPAPGLLSL